ncbi:MAG TPA: hypothetical protein VF466_00510 [Candidatus Saccharimonadales bacterium]
MADTPTLKKPKNRSTAYPGITLEEAIEAAKTLRNNLGAGPYSRDSAAIALGYTGINGASGTKIAACVHFGLLVREGNVYKQSELADQILVATSDDERLAGIRVAFTKPALYKKLAEEYNDKALPKMLDNILVRQHGITERAAKEAATLFIKSADHAGVLVNGVIKLSQAEQPLAEAAEASTAGAQDDNAPSQPTMKAPTAPSVQGGLPVVIPGTEVTIIFPVEYAFALGTGAFTDGIKLLADNIKAVQAANSNEQPVDSAEE